MCSFVCLLWFAGHKNKVSWRNLSWSCSFSFCVFLSLSLTLSWLAVKPFKPFGPSHPPLARAEINCWLKKCLATPSLRSKNTSTGCHLWYQAGYLLWIIRADTSKWYTARGICMTSLSMPCWGISTYSTMALICIFREWNRLTVVQTCSIDNKKKRQTTQDEATDLLYSDNPQHYPFLSFLATHLMQILRSQKL